MRVISGEAGGIPLKTVPGRAVRPTGDRVKESMFSVLGDISGNVVFDLFAGSGGLGLEALSRGAQRVVFVEKETRHLRVLEQNLRKVEHALPSEGRAAAEIVRGDALQVPKCFAELRGRVDLILADPPYNSPSGAPGAESLIQNPAFQQWSKGAILVLEYSTDNQPVIDEQEWSLLRRKSFGHTTLSFLKARGS
ncbi:MAG: 16S rRNA (guanine(966)-N(2))-methyltransferase RsmD [Lentisphaeria bacterium]